jgi:hypothetical protein
MQGGRDEPACRSVIQTLLTTSPRPPRLWPDNERSDAAAERPYYNQLAELKSACPPNPSTPAQEDCHGRVRRALRHRLV